MLPASVRKNRLSYGLIKGIFSVAVGRTAVRAHAVVMDIYPCVPALPSGSAVINAVSESCVGTAAARRLKCFAVNAGLNSRRDSGLRAISQSDKCQYHNTRSDEET